jgi:mannosyltransferase
MSAPSRARARPRAPERLAALPPYAWGLIALTALAAAVRLSTVGVQSYWLDEAVTVSLLHNSLGGMLQAIPGSESTPPLYYVLAWLWSKLFGTGEAGLRSLSAVIGTATIPFAYDAGARLITRRAGLVLAALAAVNPLLVWFSQEARAYALLVLLTTASFAFLARVLEKPTARRLAGWAIASALALAAHYFALFVVAPEAILLLWRLRRRALPAVGVVVVAGLALLPLAVHQASNDRADFIRESGLGRRLLQIPKQYLTGFNAPLEAAATVVSIAIVAYALWLLVTRGDTRERHGAGVAARIAIPAVGIPLLLAVLGADYLITRNLIGAWVPVMCIVAAGLAVRSAPRAGAVATAALCAVMLATVVAVEANPAYQRGDWRGAARQLGTPRAPGRAIVITPPAGAGPLGLYAPRLIGLPYPAMGVSEIVVMAIGERRTGQTQGPPRPTSFPPPPQGFDVPKITRGDNYTIARYEAQEATGWITYPILGALQLQAGAADYRFQPPPP